jgi:hypothetical protein
MDVSCDSSFNDALAAWSTFAAVVVALLAFWVPKWIRPVLTLRLASREGVHQRVRVTAPDGTGRDGAGRYFHLRVTNERRYVKAHNVQVVLLRLEEHNGDQYVDRWAGGNGIPMVWQHEHATGRVRNVGPPAYADLCHVLQGPPGEEDRAKWLALAAVFLPYGEDPVRRQPCRLRLTLQAQSDEADSDPLLVLVRWDGRWAEDGVEVRDL